MMKAFGKTVLSVIACAASIFGCSKSTENQAAQPDASSTGTVQNSETPDTNQTFEKLTDTLASEKEFVYLLEETENLPVYERGASLVSKGSNKVSEVSFHFAQWYVIQLEAKNNDNNDEIPLDAPSAARTSYLVDMANGKVIAQKDFNAIRPLLMRLIEVADSLSDDARSSFLIKAASVIAVVNAQNTAVEESDERAPRIEKSDDGIRFIYYANVGSSYVEYHRFTLTIKDSGIDINSEVDNP